MACTRRMFLAGAAALAAPVVHAQSPTAVRFALTPVFLDNDAAVISSLQAALAEGMGRDIEDTRQKGDLTADIAIDPKGRAAIKAMRRKGQVFYVEGIL